MWQTVSIVAEQKRHNCTDGRIKKVYLLSQPLDRALASHLEHYGSVNIMENLPRPLLTFVQAPHLNLKGIIGNTIIEVWYTPESLPDNERAVYRIFATCEIS
jgi:hypothetical protein